MIHSGMYRPTGELQGDTRAMPDRGTSTGLPDNPFGSDADNVGHDLDMDATNSMGSITRSSRSDVPGEENINDADAGRDSGGEQEYA